MIGEIVEGGAVFPLGAPGITSGFAPKDEESGGCSWLVENARRSLIISGGAHELESSASQRSFWLCRDRGGRRERWRDVTGANVTCANPRVPRRVSLDP